MAHYHGYLRGLVQGLQVDVQDIPRSTELAGHIAGWPYQNFGAHVDTRMLLGALGYGARRRSQEKESQARARRLWPRPWRSSCHPRVEAGPWPDVKKL